MCWIIAEFPLSGIVDFITNETVFNVINWTTNLLIIVSLITRLYRTGIKQGIKRTCTSDIVGWSLFMLLITFNVASTVSSGQKLYTLTSFIIYLIVLTFQLISVLHDKNNEKIERIIYKISCVFGTLMIGVTVAFNGIYE